MQLDVEESTPAIECYHHNSLIKATNTPFDIHTIDMKYFLVLSFGQVELWSSDTRQTDGQKAMHMSPPCISTGVLKNTQYHGHRLATICL